MCLANVRLVASRCDLIDPSALLDPLPSLSKTDLESISPDRLFRDAPACLNKFPAIRGPEYLEYVKLVAMQIKVGKAELRMQVKSGGTVFCVERAGSIKLREVWHGTEVSKAACRPPKPPSPASPDALVDLEIQALW